MRRFDHIEDAIAYLVETAERNEERIARIEEAVGVVEVFTVAQLGQRYGFSPTAASRAPWKLPNYGLKDVSRGWLRATVEAWYAKPEADHREAWETMAADERRRYRRAA